MYDYSLQAFPACTEIIDRKGLECLRLYFVYNTVQYSDMQHC